MTDLLQFKFPRVRDHVRFYNALNLLGKYIQVADQTLRDLGTLLARNKKFDGEQSSPDQIANMLSNSWQDLKEIIGRRRNFSFERMLQRLDSYKKTVLRKLKTRTQSKAREAIVRNLHVWDGESLAELRELMRDDGPLSPSLMAIFRGKTDLGKYIFGRESI